MVSQDVGYNAVKNVKGRKRFLTVETLGLVLRVFITALSVSEGVRVSYGNCQNCKSIKSRTQGISCLTASNNH